jgi:hypothetical protein
VATLRVDLVAGRVGRTVKCASALGPKPSGSRPRPSGLPSTVIECVIEACAGRVESAETISILSLGGPRSGTMPHPLVSRAAIRLVRVDVIRWSDDRGRS